MINYLGYALGALSVVALVAMLWLQLRAYRKTRHPSLETLVYASTAGMAYAGASSLARFLIRSREVALVIYCCAVVLAAVHVVLAVAGTARLFRAFETYSAEFKTAGPNNSSKPTPLRGAA